MWQLKLTGPVTPALWSLFNPSHLPFCSFKWGQVAGDLFGTGTAQDLCRFQNRLSLDSFDTLILMFAGLDYVLEEEEMWPLSGQEVVSATQGRCGELLRLEDILVTGAASDSRRVTPGDLFVAIRGEKFDGHDYVASSLERGAALALVSKTWPSLSSLSETLAARCVVVDDPQAAFRGLASFLRGRFSFPVVGIGGSNGKTTTKEMLVALLSGDEYRITKTEKSENGFLGLAITLSSRTHALSSAPHALVLEIGIDDIGAMDEHLVVGRPNTVLLTALGPEHLSHLKTWETAMQEELRLFRRPGPSSRVWQLEDPALALLRGEIRSGDVVVTSRATATLLGISDFNVYVKKGVSVLFFEASGDERGSSVQTWWHAASGVAAGEVRAEWMLPLPGAHNAANFALACATALSMGRTLREMRSGWKRFEAPPMRSRLVDLPNGCVLLDDCYNASPASMRAAFDILRQESWRAIPKLVVLGDMLDLGEESRKWHLQLVEPLKELTDVHLCFFGDAMYDVFQEVQKDAENAQRQRRTMVHMPTVQDPRLFLETAPYPLDKSVVLVKGSRGMDLGRVVVRIEEKCR